MKNIVSVWLAAVIIITFFAGCRATPEEPPVVGKDTEQMIETAMDGDEDSVILKAMKAPEFYQTELTSIDGSVTIRVDADVVLPDTDKIPTATVEKHLFSQETADRLMELLLQGMTLYEMDGYMQATKEEIEARLVELYAMRAGTIPVEVDGDLEETIVICERELENAPEEIDRTPARTALEPDGIIEGVAEIDGVPAYFMVRNDAAENRIDAQFYRHMRGHRMYGPADMLVGKLGIDSAELEPKITAEEARTRGDALIEELGLSYMVCGYTELGVYMNGAVTAEGEPDYAGMPTAHILHYVRETEGIPLTYTGHTGRLLTDEVDYAKPWSYEAVTVVIDETGIIEFRWTSPYTEPEIVTGDTNLLAFDEIRDVFEKMLLIEYPSYIDGAMQIDIDSVKLGLMRVTNPNRRDSGLLIPVWDFFGTMTLTTEKKQWSNPRESLLTINAIDGSVIDRGLGY